MEKIAERTKRARAYNTRQTFSVPQLRVIAAALGIAPERARQILYVYCRAGLLAEQGRAGRQKQYAYAALPSRRETTT